MDNGDPAHEDINSIKWNVYGKITEITRNSTGGVPVTNIKYYYDAMGNRIGKVFDLGGNKRYTWYVRDAQGNVLSIYDDNNGGTKALADLDVQQASATAGRDIVSSFCDDVVVCLMSLAFFMPPNVR